MKHLTINLSLGNGGSLEVETLPALGWATEPAIMVRVLGPNGGRLNTILLTPQETLELAAALAAEAGIRP